MSRFVIRNVTKILQATSARLFGRKSPGTGPAEELTAADVLTMLNVYTISQTDSAISTAVAALVASSPAALDTLNELAAALGNDASFATTVTTALASKAAVSHGHVIADVSGLQTALDGKQAAGTYTTLAFKAISVSGQSDVVADAADDTLTLVAGSGVTITTSAAGDSITIAAAGGSPGGSTKQVQFNNAGSFGGAAGFEYQSGGSPNVSIVAQGASHVPLCVKGAASQTGNLQEWQNSSGTVLTSIGSGGKITLNGSGFVCDAGSVGYLRGRALVALFSDIDYTIAGFKTSGAVEAGSMISAGTYTVGTLPSASANPGRCAQVTDSSVTTFGSIVAGGGANRVPVFSNGTNWVVA